MNDVACHRFRCMNVSEFPSLSPLACRDSSAGTEMPATPWQSLLPVQKLSAHREHCYGDDVIAGIGPVTHVRVTMAPDGGISRLRLWGMLSD